MVELLVVIGVIGIVVGSLITLINPVTQLRRARDATRKSDISQIRAALELYRSDVTIYRAQTPPFADPGTGVIGCGVSLMGGFGNTYMLRVPCDPLHPAAGSRYFYNSTPPNLSYIMWACLENVDDDDRDCTDGGACVPDPDRCPAAGRVSFTLRNP